MERIILMVLHYLLVVPYWWSKISKCAKDTEFQKYSAEERYELLQKLTTMANRAGRVDVQCYGRENLPEENGYIMFPNHQGLFDSLLFFETHGRPFAVVMKKEVSNTFLVKQIGAITGSMAMDRSDVRQSMKVIRTVADEVKKGRNFIIFPEGTRSRQGNTLLPFKAGAFKSAVYAKCPIVPVAILDSYKAFDTHSIKKMTAQIHYLEPIFYEEYKDMKTSDIAEIVKKRIEDEIKKFDHGKIQIH